MKCEAHLYALDLDAVELPLLDGKVRRVPMRARVDGKRHVGPGGAKRPVKPSREEVRQRSVTRQLAGTAVGDSCWGAGGVGEDLVLLRWRVLRPGLKEAGP
jgi:hypothetical protein